jgi:(E)-4-hydroxy-3-methylbut-2-enyl-diphosphate synthase
VFRVEDSLPWKYCEDITKTKRRPTRFDYNFLIYIRFSHYYFKRTVHVGKVQLGSEHPVAKQTMTTTNTRDVGASVDQVNF